MSQYLTKEEIKHWRSSLEKVTLEEYARRLGKIIEEDKKTCDLIDIVMQNEKRLYTSKVTKAKENILEISQKSQEIQKEILADTPNIPTGIKSKLTYKKPLTERENKVLDYFIKNKSQVVYAKDIAKMLNLPSDYIYKYIKNLRTKISEDILQNSPSGGYILNY